MWFSSFDSVTLLTVSIAWGLSCSMVFLMAKLKHVVFDLRWDGIDTMLETYKLDAHCCT